MYILYFYKQEGFGKGQINYENCVGIFLYQIAWEGKKKKKTQASHGYNNVIP